MKAFLTISLLVISSGTIAQNIIITKKRPPQIDISAYQKIAIGDIVGADGFKTTRSMDLNDAVTSQLFNHSDGHEIIDRNALQQILSSQKGITAIDENTIATLSKKVSSALMIVARIQNEKIYNNHKTRQGATNGCPVLYWDEITGDMTAQVKIIDVKTGRMIFTNPITQSVKAQTKEDCDSHNVDTEPLLKEATVKLADKINRLILPWEESIDLPFIKPMSLFKAPFKKLPTVIEFFQAGNNSAGLEVLKGYLDDTSLKQDVHEMAAYNYGVGLFIDNQYKQAMDYFKMAKDLNTSFAAAMINKTQTEQNFEYQLASKQTKPITK